MVDAAGNGSSVNIVVAFVPSALGEEVLRRGVVAAKQRGGRVVVVNSSRGDAPIDERFAQRDALDRLRRELEASDIDFEIRQPVRGRNPEEEVLDIAEEVEAALVVIGLRRRSAVGKFIMGSTAQKILLDASCPVLAVKAPK